MKVIEKLRAIAQASIDDDAFSETPWDAGRLSVYDAADEVAPSNLKSWAIRQLEYQEEETDSMVQLMAGGWSNSRVQQSEGKEAGYRDIIDELCTREASL